MTEVDERTMTFEFQSKKAQIMDISPWSVQGHFLSLKECRGDISIEEIEFNKMHMWVQVYGLSLEMHNKENARNIGNSTGRCIAAEEDSGAKHRLFMRVKLEVDVSKPLVEGFWWTTRGNLLGAKITGQLGEAWKLEY